MIARFLRVGLGGAIGAIFRYVNSLILRKGGFPVLTLVTSYHLLETGKGTGDACS